MEIGDGVHIRADTTIDFDCPEIEANATVTHKAKRIIMIDPQGKAWTYFSTNFKISEWVPYEGQLPEL